MNAFSSPQMVARARSRSRTRACSRACRTLRFVDRERRRAMTTDGDEMRQPPFVLDTVTVYARRLARSEIMNRRLGTKRLLVAARRRRRV